MTLNDFAATMNIVGVMLVLIFTVRWRGRPARNAMVGNIGIAMILVGAAIHLALWASSRV